jgi:hypothetical protein
VTDAMGNGANLGGFEGTAAVEVPHGAESYPVGPDLNNAGRYIYHLDVVSASVTQHF